MAVAPKRKAKVSQKAAVVILGPTKLSLKMFDSLEALSDNEHILDPQWQAEGMGSPIQYCF